MTCYKFLTVCQIKHVLSVLILIGCILSVYGVGTLLTNEGTTQNSTIPTGFGGTLVLFVLQLIAVIKFPLCMCNFLGVVLVNNFEKRPKLQHSPPHCPFLCFRVVTRGMFPGLVRKTVQLNLQTCKNIGLQNFVIEVVSDKSVNLLNNKLCRETIVPVNYRTSNGSLFKARALQYALEPGVDFLKPGDWIIHLDEETILTEDSLIGIINFVGLKKHSFGQGHITYGNGEVVNWITTLADSIRLGIDYGFRRFCFGVLHRPVFGMKGSFFVADAEAEKNVSFDNGPEASITEDCFFACFAYSKGYSFGFIEGSMYEQSTFTLQDFIKQKRRWMHGILLTALSEKIPVRNKVGPILFSLSSCLQPLELFLIIIKLAFWLPQPPLLTILSCFIWGTNIFLSLLGTFQTFDVLQHGFWKCLLLIVATIPCCLLPCCVEYWNSVVIFWNLKKSMSHFHFHVVDKEIASKDSSKVN